jgi:hypothetical protein
MLGFSITATLSLSGPDQNVGATHCVDRQVSVAWVLADFPGTGSLKIRPSNSASAWLCGRLAGRQPMG